LFIGDVERWVVKVSLCRAPLFIGDFERWVGQVSLCRAHLFIGDLEFVEGWLWLWSISLYGNSDGNLEGGGSSFARGLDGYLRKAVGTGISLYGGSVGQPGEGLSTGDFEIWLKGALEVERLSLWSSVKVTQREGSLAGDPGG
jgi:hypothetical protein